MENDKTATMSLKLTDRIPVREIEIDTEAQNPDFELNVLHHFENFSDENNSDELDVLKKLGFNKKLIFPLQNFMGYLNLKESKK